MGVDLETTSGASEIKNDLKDVAISGAKEINVTSARVVVVVYFPFRIWHRVKKIHSRLIRELEKKLSGKHVIFVASRTILDKNHRRMGVKERPRTRTLTSVHDAILEDVCGPTEI